MLGSCEVMTSVGTTDPAKTRDFYERVLGLRFVADEPYALVFDLKGIMLRIQKVAEVSPVPYTTLGWRVEDIESVVRELSNRGIAFERYEGMPQDELGIWSVPGANAKVAWFKDPDGNTLSLTASTTSGTNGHG